GRLTLTVPELKKFAVDYAAMSKEMGAASQQFADILKPEAPKPAAAAKPAKADEEGEHEDEGAAKAEAAKAEADLAGLKAQLKSAETAMEAATKKEDPLVDGLNKFCSG